MSEYVEKSHSIIVQTQNKVNYCFNTENCYNAGFTNKKLTDNNNKERALNV